MRDLTFVAFIVLAILLAPIVLTIQNHFVYTDSPFLTNEYTSVRVHNILIKYFNYTPYDYIYVLAKGNYSSILKTLHDSLKYLPGGEIITPYSYINQLNETIINYSQPIINSTYRELLPLHELYENLSIERVLIISNVSEFQYQLNVTYGIPLGNEVKQSLQALEFYKIYSSLNGTMLERARNASLIVFKNPYILLFSFNNYSNTSLVYETIANFNNYSYLVKLLTGKEVPEEALENPYAYVISKLPHPITLSDFHKNDTWLFIIRVPSNESLNNVLEFMSSVNYTVTGHLPIYAKSEEVTDSDIRTIDIVTVVLIVTFLAILLRALVPLLILITSAVIGLEIAYGLLYLSTFLGYGIYYISGLVVPPIVFGITVDYSILFLYRYFEELSKNGKDALKVAYKNSRRAILFSGLSIALGFVSFTLSPSPLLRNIGIALIIASVSSLIPATFYMKSMLSNIPVRYLKFPRRELPSHVDVRQRYLSVMSRDAIRFKYVVLAVMVIVAIISYYSFLHFNTTVSINEILPSYSSVSKGLNELSSYFNYSIDYIVLKGDPNSSYASIYNISKMIIDKGGLVFGPASIGKTLLNHSVASIVNHFYSRNYTLIEAYVPYPVFSNDAINLTKELINMGYMVGGENAQRIDIVDNTVSIYYSLVLPLTILIITVYLGIVLGSIIVPIRLSLTLLFSALIGVMLMHITYGEVYWLSPLIVFAIMYSLGIDYDMFIIVRILEERGSEEERIIKSVENTGLAVTSAGIILAGAFFSLMASHMRFLNEIGFAVGLTILFDTFIVRPILVPAIMSILKKYNWWPRVRNLT